jgi:hypothetical protein
MIGSGLIGLMELRRNASKIFEKRSLTVVLYCWGCYILKLILLCVVLLGWGREGSYDIRSHFDTVNKLINQLR